MKEVGYKGGKNLTSSSIKESKRRGCFVEKLTIVPKTIEIKGAKIQINEIWIEKNHNLSSIISFLPTILEYPIFINKKEFSINFNFVQDELPVALDIDGWLFILEGKEDSFGYHGRNLLSAEMKNLSWKNIKIFLTNDYGVENGKIFFKKAKTYLILRDQQTTSVK